MKLITGIQQTLQHQYINELNNNEIIVYGDKGLDNKKTINIAGNEYSIVEKIKSFPLKDDFEAQILDNYFIIVNDTTMNLIYESQKVAYGEAQSYKIYKMNFDLSGSDAEKITCAKAIENSLSEYFMNTNAYSVDCKQVVSDGFYSVYGGLFFLGLFLGTLFLMATVLIIYYKQISEGYEDKERFDIMQKVGMSHSEVKSTISAQVIKVFFLPIVMAGIHVAFAFKLITKLLALLNLFNTKLFLVCTLGTVAVFAVIYGIVYLVTAREYYKIVT